MAISLMSAVLWAGKKKMKRKTKPRTGCFIRRPCETHGMQLVKMEFGLIAMACGCKLKLDIETGSWVEIRDVVEQPA